MAADPEPGHGVIVHDANGPVANNNRSGVKASIYIKKQSS